VVVRLLHILVAMAWLRAPQAGSSPIKPNQTCCGVGLSQKWTSPWGMVVVSNPVKQGIGDYDYNYDLD
jgi:hypothetical protein